MTRLFSEIQFLEQNYDIVKCNIWMRQVAEIQNKVFEDKIVEGKILTFLEFYIVYFREWQSGIFTFIVSLNPLSLKWYYDENRIFPIEAILKHKQVLCMRRKMPLLISETFKFLKYAIQPSDDVIYSTKFWSDMMKNDISANL